MATVRCPFCGDEIVPLPVEPEADEGAIMYRCPTCRRRLTIDVIDEYVEREEEEAAG